MANHMMINIETLDTRPSAVVFQVGVICFKDVLHGDMRGEHILEKQIFHLDILGQIMAGRTLDSETIKWWREQKTSSWFRLRSQISDTVFVFSEIARMYGEHGVGFLWSNSPSFDAVIMRSLKESLGIVQDFPSFREDFDLRTLKRLFQIMGRKMEREPKETTHNALEDCVDQVEEVIHYLADFRGMIDTMTRYEMDDLVPRERQTDKPALT